MIQFYMLMLYHWYYTEGAFDKESELAIMSKLISSSVCLPRAHTYLIVNLQTVGYVYFSLLVLPVQRDHLHVIFVYTLKYFDGL
jgi:hypothetical protein